jgi:hypothetical protein
VCCPCTLIQICGVASNPTPPSLRGNFSLVLHLEELGCMTLMPCHHLLPSQWGQLMMMRGQDQEALLQVRLSAWEACGKGAQFLVTDV